MDRKRRNTSSPEPDSPSPKRSRQSSTSSYDSEEDEWQAANEAPRTDFVTGQRGAFPGLDDSAEELFYGPANDGIEYLRMVR